MGKKLEVKDLSDGYVKNFLLPKNLVKEATIEALKKLEAQKRAMEASEAALISSLKESADKIKSLTLKFTLKVGDGGGVFGSVSKADIEKSLSEKGFKNFFVELEKPIKKIGEYSLNINLGKGIKPVVKVIISPQV